MAFTRATGKHRRPSRLKRTTARAAGVAALATTGVIGTLAAPALAAETPPSSRPASRRSSPSATRSPTSIDAQAAAQQHAADEAAASRRPRGRSRSEPPRPRRAKAKAKKEREAKERAAREAERKRLNSFVSPISGSYVSTGYKAGGALWSSGSHTGVDFHAASRHLRPRGRRRHRRRGRLGRRPTATTSSSR